MRLVFAFLGMWIMAACVETVSRNSTLFQNVASTSGITFRNNLQHTDRLNPYTYRNFYNGAGVAVGDINNDGLLDIYFAANQADNRLYLNKGGFVFEDITNQAGVACSGAWSTGVTFVDINADGLLDIYVCKSGDPEGPNRHNELFINNGNLTFTERAKEYGLNITGLAVQASFFDYDKDGDLDCYLLTNSFKMVGAYDLVKNQREIPDPQGGGNKFFLNVDGKFKDYTAEAGIYRSNIGFGLGITLGDFNEDTWPDVFISNDFFERDYLYINNQKGGFEESLTTYFSSISMGSMGADFADLDNNGEPELFVTEMLPDSLHRRKSKTVFETWDKYQLNVQAGYHHQFSRNVLQTKIGSQSYAEVGRLAGVAASEWSWGALLFDMDNDGLRDVFVANGIYKDLLDRDYLAFNASDENIRRIIQQDSNPILKLIEQMPTSAFPNYAFKNTGNLEFVNQAQLWGLAEPQYSSGSAYGDFDNDGDVDLVLNNTNGAAAIYRNNTDTSLYKSLTIRLRSNSKNTLAVGSIVKVYAAGKQWVADNFVTRGFQSSVQPWITIGLGSGVGLVDSLIVEWPAGGRTVLLNQSVNRVITIDSESAYKKLDTKPMRRVLELVLVDSTLFRHQSSGLNDFNRDRLLPMMYSNETPSIARVDFDKDGTDGFFVGGGKGQAGVIISKEEAFVANAPTWNTSSLEEQTRCVFFDVDQDGDLDFYLASGGRFYSQASEVLMDRIFLNNGQQIFAQSPYALPFSGFVSTSVVKPFDFDRDGDQDLFVGERFDPFVYGKGGRGFLFENDGTGKFTDVTKEKAPALLDQAMITDAAVADIEGDGWQDLVMVGDWVKPRVLLNRAGKLEGSHATIDFPVDTGWWHTIEQADLNQDGKPDFLIGNHGRNSFFKMGDRMYLGDFDRNGSAEQIFCTSIGGRYFPISDKDDFLAQLPSLRKQLLYYKDYSKKPIDELLNSDALAKAIVFQVNQLASVMLLSGQNGYRLVELPQEAQYAPIYSFVVDDFDGDSIADIIAGGNHLKVKPQFGPNDASEGWFFKGELEGGDYTLNQGESLGIKGEIRDIEVLKDGQEKYLIFTKHGHNVEIYKIK